MAPSATTWAVIVSWNVADLLRNGLASLAKAEPRPGVVVVDNASTDGTPAMIRREFPDAFLIENRENAGFASATNQGVRAALDQGAGRVLLINPDASLPPGTLAMLERELDGNPSIGLTAPALVNPDGTAQAFAFGGDPSLAYLLRRGIRRLLRLPPLHAWNSQTDLEPDWITGACILARADVFRSGIWFDERFFLYFEDNDWCLRARKAGWRILRIPAVRAVHASGASLKQNPEAGGAYVGSLRLFYSKHYPRWQGWVLGGLLGGYRLMRPTPDADHRSLGPWRE